MRSFLFRTAMECPTRLWYHRTEYPENSDGRTYVRHARYNRRQVEALLRALHPGGVRVEGETVQERAEHTRRLLDSGEQILYDAQFLSGGCRARVPLLRREDALELYDVQTKAFHPGKQRLSDASGAIHSKWARYLIDLAFRREVASDSRPGETFRCHLVFPNSSGKAANDALHRLLEEERPLPEPEGELLATVPTDRELERVRRGVLFPGTAWEGMDLPQAMQRALELLHSGEKPEPEPGYKCRGCEFRLGREDGRHPNGFAECWSGRMEEDARHTFELIGPGVRRWSEEGIFLQREIPEREIASAAQVRESPRNLTAKQRQSLQVLGNRGEPLPTEIVRRNLHEELRELEYPIHFIDFEAGNYAIPARRGCSPYRLELFQYSCHSLRRDGNWTHHQWICSEDEVCSNYGLVRSLAEVPELLQGTVVQYSGFEQHALRQVRRELRDDLRRSGEGEAKGGSIHDAYDLEGLLQWLDAMLDERRPPGVVDMSRLVRDYYYNRHMEASLGIKEVLHSVMSLGGSVRERWSKPYRGSNFDGIVWWQPDSGGKGARDPYRILVEEGAGNEAADEGIRRGAEAMVGYAELRSGRLSPAERESRVQSLLKYCELDTLAMLITYQHWNHEGGLGIKEL